MRNQNIHKSAFIVTNCFEEEEIKFKFKPLNLHISRTVTEMITNKLNQILKFKLNTYTYIYVRNIDRLVGSYQLSVKLFHNIT